ncbi:MAG: hypothetical protein KKH04_11950 [Proteobacteria bacterium]|nr:hypothetical protein [Pseudomonadota bacterium]
MNNQYPDIERLRSIKTLPQLIAYLRDELEWPIGRDDIEDVTFDYDPEELGFDAASSVRFKEIKQIRPLESNQPWGIFWINFEKKRLPVVMLRRILANLAIKKRPSARKGDRPAWRPHDLLFISAYGEDHDRAITFAHFWQNPESPGDLAILKVLGWDGGDTVLHLADAHHTLTEKLRWPENPSDVESWRKQWASAFILRHQEVIATAQELVEELARLAIAIRKRANTILSRESKRGPMRQLCAAFQTALIHDLTEDDFADVIAQTISYGLLAARFSRPAGISVQNLVDMVPPTNPFLRGLLGMFLNVAGRKEAFDFDELGIQEVVELLNIANAEAVKADFGNLTRNEDPVIHFYEHFLKAYDSKKKVQRGVFFTPLPVVSYIVRSVHELLQTEFGIEDGLASTVSWGEMVKRNKDLKIPDGVKPDEFFVTMLDPATGTATFLVKIIEIIFCYIKDKWDEKGYASMPPLPGRKPVIENRRFTDYWNAYVPQALLPRLYGYELMMAPYTIAHMKLGLKLSEINARLGQPDYQVKFEGRAHIYLTNSLEPQSDVQPALAGIFPALAHEAQAVNAVKRNKRFTVVIGNPPYSKISSNLTPEMRETVERYRFVDGERIKERGALQFEINLQDDYVKFFRFCENQIVISSVGILGLITNNGYISTPTLRGMRNSLLETFESIWALDLHGHLAKGEVAPDGTPEGNVFDILQGVAIFLGSHLKKKGGNAAVFHTDYYGSRAIKYLLLQKSSRTSTNFSHIKPSAPFYLFIPHDADLGQEWNLGVGLSELFPKNSAGIITARDGLVIAENRRLLAERLDLFSKARGSEATIYGEFGFSESKRFDLRDSQAGLRKLKSYTEPIRRILHRPFDERFIFFHSSVVWSMSRPMADQMRGGDNIALVATRQVTRPQFEHVFVSRHIIEIKACSHDRNTQIFPLFIIGEGDKLGLASGTTPNLKGTVFIKLSQALGLKINFGERGIGRDDELTPMRFFNYVYAVMHSPNYRARYFEFLRSDFPRLPLTDNLELFHALTKHGEELIALHLMESPRLEKHIAKWVGKVPSGEVEKVTYADRTVWIDKFGSEGFCSVPETVWNFHIGGYQVCEKWIKDRRGRRLSAADIDHYQKIVVAINETLSLMSEIDKVIEQHGGWPEAFALKKQGGDSANGMDPSSPSKAYAKQASMDSVQLKLAAEDHPSEYPSGENAREKPVQNEIEEEKRETIGKEESDTKKEEYDFDELIIRVRKFVSEAGSEGIERGELIKSIAQELGFQRAGSRISEDINSAINASSRRGISNVQNDVVYPYCRSIQEYDREFLKEMFISAIGNTWISREDAIRAASRYLGFTRTGESIQENLKSVISGLIRQGRLEAEGEWIRKL